MYCIITTACSTRDEAGKIAGALLEERLAACVQIKEVESFYKWDNEIHHEEEYVLSIKTIDANYDKIRERVLELHSYEVPELIKIGIEDGLDEYLSWINANTEEKS